MAELVLRSWWPQLNYRAFLDSRLAPFVKNDVIPFSLQPNARTQQYSIVGDGRLVEITTNSRGMRGREVSLKKPGGVRRVLALGDSFTFGLGVGDEETYPAHLEKLLQDAGFNFEVLNAGFASGGSPDQAYAWLNQVGLSFSPDLVVLGYYNGNDIPGILRNNWTVRDERGLPLNIVDPHLFVDELGVLRAKEPTLKQISFRQFMRLPIVRDSHLLALFYFVGPTTVWRKLSGQSSDSVSNGYKVKDFPTLFQATAREPSFLQQERDFRELLLGFKTLTIARGMRFILLLIPPSIEYDPSLIHLLFRDEKLRVERDYFAELTPFLAEHEIEFINLLRAFRANPGNYYPQREEVHLTSEGYSFIARELAAKIVDGVR